MSFRFKKKFSKVRSSKKLKKFTYQSSSCASNFISQEVIFFSMSSGYLSFKQLSACHNILIKRLKSYGFRVVKFVSSDKPLFKRPLGSRIGKGKGSFSSWSCKVSYGQKLFSVLGVTTVFCFRRVLADVSKKLPIKLSFFKSPLIIKAWFNYF